MSAAQTWRIDIDQLYLFVVPFDHPLLEQKDLKSPRGDNAHFLKIDDHGLCALVNSQSDFSPELTGRDFVKNTR